MNQRPPEILTVPAYSYAEADGLAHVSSGTSKRWIEGYSYTNTKGERSPRTSHARPCQYKRHLIP